MNPARKKEDYYARVTAQDIGEVAREILGDRLTREGAENLRFDCPHHQSRSKASFIVDVTKQAFWCKGCGVGGRIGMAPMGRAGLSAEEQKVAEAQRQEEESVFSVLTALAEFYHDKLIARADVLKWFTARYAIGRETIERASWAVSLNTRASPVS